MTKVRAIVATLDLPNLNGDIFSSEEMVKAKDTYIGKDVTLGFDSNISVGKVESTKVEDGFLTCEFSVNNPQIEAKIKSGAISNVGWAGHIKETECPICGITATTPQEFCEHLKTSNGGIHKGIEFTSLALLDIGADENAKILK